MQNTAGLPAAASDRKAGRWYAASAALVLVIMCVRIVSTYTVFTQTCDEPFHIACGMEWLDKGVYLYEAQHPPLSRIAAAIGPYLAGERSHGLAKPIPEGNAILGSGARYTRNLALARLGELPFVVLAGVGVWVWARRYYGDRAAFFAVLLFSMAPPLLAHGGMATTDMAITATCTWAIYAWLRFLESPTPKSSMLLGLWCGLALISKFTSILFLGGGFLAIWIAYVACTSSWGSIRIRNAGRLLRIAVPAVAVACLIVWACFRFSFAPFFAADDLARRQADFSPRLTRPGLVHTVVTTIPVPAGQYFRGLGQVWRHNNGGQWSYLLGARSPSGFWYYFPVVLVLKTPLGFLLLVLAGAVFLILRLWRNGDWMRAAPVLFTVVVVASCLPSRINIGVRHVLPVYPALAIVAGVVISEALRQRRRVYGVLALACLVWCCISSALAHPDYLSYLNEIAPGPPERYVVDSDLDWGQDLGRLAIRLKQLQAPSLTMSYFGTADLSRFDLPPVYGVPCDSRFEGYVAASVMMLKMHGPIWSPCPAAFETLSHAKPLERVGRSILLYRFPERPQASGTSSPTIRDSIQ